MDLESNDGHAPARSGHRTEIRGFPKSVAEALDAALQEAPDRTALVCRDARFSFAELDRAIDRAAHALRRLGLRKGDRLAASLGNHAEIVIAFMAAVRQGVIWVGINRALAPPEKAFLLADSGARILIGDRAACREIETRRPQLPELQRIVDAEPGDADSAWSALLARGADGSQPRPETDPFAPAAIAYTGGTTGRPKGVVHSQHNMLLPGVRAVACEGAGPDVIQGVCLPLTTLNLMILGPVQSALARCTCVLLDRVDAPGVAEWVRREKIVALAAVPAIFQDLLTHPDVHDDDLATLTRPRVGGAICPEAVKRLFEQRFGYEVQDSYGLTEAPTAVARTDPAGPPVAGSVGRALEHVEIRIATEDGGEAPTGVTGEICVGPRREGPFSGLYRPMLGYWKRPEATDQALRGGLLHTGDIGFLDAAGNLFLRDRKSDVIIRGGANVYPAEVERVLHEDARVAACAVLGVEDARLGERVVAAVQLRSADSATESELLDRCRESLARYKIPDRIVFVDAFPRTPMGKVHKRALAPLFA